LIVFFALAGAKAGDDETPRFLGPEADWSFARLELRGRGMAGGTSIALCGSGSVCVRIFSGAEERRFLFTIEKKEALAILTVAAGEDVLAAKPRERQGHPDEARPELVLENALGLTRAVRWWAGEEPPQAAKVLAALAPLEKKTEKLEPVYEGKEDAFFRPFAGVPVTIALYSGRPDPTFELVRPEDHAKLEALVKDLEAAERPKEKDAPGLGYHGFLLTPRGLAGVPKWISVFKGTIQLGDSPRDRVYKKDKKGLEDWLTAEAKKRGFETKAPR